MWMSNIAAAALMIACLRPILSEFAAEDQIRRTLLIGVALGADLGGIATPIGTGPNAIAIASISSKTSVSFADWMTFALPLTFGMLVVAFAVLAFRSRRAANGWKQPSIINSKPTDATHEDAKRPLPFVILIVGTVLCWLTEPIHGIPASVTSITAAAIMFATGMLRKEHLRKIDWSTLILIAGGITLGRLLERSGTIGMLTESLPFSELNPTAALFIICIFSALFSALMSNTATVVMLIPIASAIIPEPSTAILVAISASFGIPFIISTPQNAMAYGEGGLRTTDLLYPGIVILVLGCLVVSLTGKFVLGLVGIP
jgi:sodium-dependent dicarboxylate transporter 2/3/5